MLSKHTKAMIVKGKMLKDPFDKVNTTSLTEKEVLKLYQDTGLTYKLVIWSTSSATYFKIENNLN